MKVNEPRCSVFYHYVAALEVAIHKCPGVLLFVQVYKGAGQSGEVILQHVLAEVGEGSFQKAVLEVVQVPHYALFVEGFHRVASLVGQPLRAAILYVGQQADGCRQQLYFSLAEASRSASFRDCFKEGQVAQVFLQIAQPVSRLVQHLRHGQTLLAEEVAQIDECFVLIGRHAAYAYYGRS